ncbi:MAG: hypothetical protein ACFFAO_14725 [Candidatus Hermodarchaeota archaeon]
MKNNEIRLVFVSASGRCGTGYLSNLINENACNATSEHEPYPRGEGLPSKWYDKQNSLALKKLALKKLARIKRGRKYGKFAVIRSITRKKNKLLIPPNLILRNLFPSVEIKDIYAETSHTFVKSFGEEMVKLRPDLRLIHLTRNPLEVAKSFFNRNSIPGLSPFLLDPNFKRNEIKIPLTMTAFQKCLWYWFETEIRHIKFIENYDLKVIDVDIKELTERKFVEKMFKTLAIEFKSVNLDLDRNKNIKATYISPNEIKEAKEVINAIPDHIFDKIGDKYSVRDNLTKDTL